MMGIGGLIAKAIDLKTQKPLKQCERCGLHYPLNEPSCVHCADLDGRELADLRERLDKEQASNQNLGRIFAVLALIILIMLVLSFTGES